MKKVQSAQFFGVYFPWVGPKQPMAGFGMNIFMEGNDCYTTREFKGLILELVPQDIDPKAYQFVRATTKLSVMVGEFSPLAMVTPTGELVAGDERRVRESAKASLPVFEKNERLLVALMLAEFLNHQEAIKRLEEKLTVKEGSEIVEGFRKIWLPLLNRGQRIGECSL